MLTMPVEAGVAVASPPNRILAVGRSETVLFDVGQLDLIVFGGMVPPDTKEHLREQISTRNPAIAFVQGYAGIPGLVAEQVEAALSAAAIGPTAPVTYDAQSRSIGISLQRPQDVTVIAWWHTSFV